MAGGPVASTRTRVDAKVVWPGHRRRRRLPAQQVEGVAGRWAGSARRPPRPAAAEREGSPLTSAPSVRTTSSSVTRDVTGFRHGRNGVVGAPAGAPTGRRDRRRPSGAPPRTGPRTAAAPGIVALPGHGASGGGHRHA